MTDTPRITHVKDWVRRHPLTAFFLGIVVMFSGGFWALQHSQDVQNYQRCLDARAGREVLRQVVELSGQNGGGGNLGDLMPLVPGFARLDEDTQEFMVNFGEFVSQPRPGDDGTDDRSFQDKALEILVLRDCQRPGLLP